MISFPPCFRQFLTPSPAVRSGLALCLMLATASPALAEDATPWSYADEQLALLAMDDIFKRGQFTMPAEAAEELWQMGMDAQSHNSTMVWATACLHVVRLGLRVDEGEGATSSEIELELDSESILRSVIQKTAAPSDRPLRLEAYELLAAVQLAAGNPALSAQTLEKAASQALDGNLTAQAAKQWLDAAKLRRQLNHAAKLRAVWAKIDKLVTARANTLPRPLLDELAAERQRAQPLLAIWPERTSAAPQHMQPWQADVATSLTTSEDGIGVTHLINEQLTSSPGELTCAVDGAKIASIASGANGVAILLEKGQTDSQSYPLRLLPLHDVKVSVVAGSSVASATVRLNWKPTAAAAGKEAAAQFQFSTLAETDEVSILGQATLHQAPSVPVPIEHQLYFRGLGNRIENVLVKPSQPARLEIYEKDTGELLAIDAEGDGVFDSKADWLASAGDADENGYLDTHLNSQQQVAAWEIYTLPHQSSAEPTSVQFFLAKDGDWIPQGQDSVTGP